MRAKLYVVGLGIRFPAHLTFEAWEALNQAERIFTLLTPDQIGRLPPALAHRTESVRPLYLDNRPRQQNYTAVIERVLAATVSGSTVAWLTWGHPLVLDSVSSTLLRIAAEQGIDCRTCIGISSIDSVIADMDYDPVNGLMIIECTTAVLREVSIDPQVALLLMQPGTFATHYPRLKGSSPPVDLSQLREYLRQIYGPSHEACFVSSSADEIHPATVVRMSIERLHTADAVVLRSSSLFIPPLKGRQVTRRPALLRQMQEEANRY